MSEVKKIATRASYGAALVELGKEHENLVVLDAVHRCRRGGRRVIVIINRRARPVRTNFFVRLLFNHNRSFGNNFQRIKH